MKKLYACALLAAVVLSLTLFCSKPGFAQSRDPRVISARAGGINFVVGEVLVTRAGSTAPLALTTADNLRAGDLIKTGNDGRVEVLLNPGSYVRIGAGAEFTMVDASLDHLRLKLNRGAFVAEVIDFDDGQPVLMLDTPQTQISIIKSGVYHIEVLAGGTTEVAVFKGRAQVGPGAVLVKDGHKMLVANGGAMEVAKLDKKEADALDAWSRERAQLLAKANGRVTRNRTLVSALQRLHSMDAGYGYGWVPAGYSSRGNGYWVFDSFAGTWVFIPFYWRPVNCPYGFNYNNVLYVPPPQGTLPNNVPCRGCPSAKLSDQRVGRGWDSPSDDFPKNGGGSKMLPAPTRSEPVFVKPAKGSESGDPPRKLPQ